MGNRTRCTWGLEHRDESSPSVGGAKGDSPALTHVWWQGLICLSPVCTHAYCLYVFILWVSASLCFSAFQS